MYSYVVNSGNFEFDGGVKTMFGVTVLSGGSTVKERSAVSYNGKIMEAIVGVLNKNSLDPVHLDDVLEDIATYKDMYSFIYDAE